MINWEKQLNKYRIGKKPNGKFAIQKRIMPFVWVNMKCESFVTGGHFLRNFDSKEEALNYIKSIVSENPKNWIFVKASSIKESEDAK